MSLKLTKLGNLDFIDLQLPKEKYFQDVMNLCTSQIIKKREEQILKVLEDNGYKFENRMELEAFAKTRCVLISFQDSSKKILIVDGKEICEWFETSRFENDDNKFTCIIGEPPSTCKK